MRWVYDGLSPTPASPDGAPRSVVAGQVPLDVGQIDLVPILPHGFGGGDFLPILVATPARASGAAFHLPLAVDAGRAKRQRIEACQRDLHLAHFADAVRALGQARQSSIDLVQLAGLQLRQL